TYPFQRQRYWVETFNNGLVKAEPLSQKDVQTPIVNLLHQGDTQQLTQQLATELSIDEAKYLPKLLEVLVRQHQKQIKTIFIKDWLYQVEWQPLQRDHSPDHAASPSLFRKGDSWLILSDQRGVGRSLAELLQQRGQSCLMVYPGQLYECLGTRTWCLNPSHPSDYERLFQDVAASELSLKGVIHLWSLEATQPENLTIPALQQAQSWGCGSVLHLVQTLIKRHEVCAPSSLPSPRLWLVTRGAMPVGSMLSAVAQAPLWGLGKVVALEHPDLWGGMLDLATPVRSTGGLRVPSGDGGETPAGDWLHAGSSAGRPRSNDWLPDSTKDEAVALLAEIEDSQGEDHLAFRSGQRYVARLVPTQPPEPQGLSLRSSSTYLITGGLGALGLQIAQWMVEAGARYLVLTGRRGASTQAQETITCMEQTGAKVLVAQADVSDEKDMVRVLEEVKASMPPLHGIVHAAGVVGYQAIQDMDLNTLNSVLRPKVLGTWILHQLTQEMKLDFFVGFSSIASVWGSKGQAHYAAANHFIDALVYYRKGLGLPALSVNWGPWAKGGMAASEEAQQWLTRMGVKALLPDEALTALRVLLGGDYPQTTVANVDWTRFKGIYEARGQRPLLEKIETQQREPAQQQEQRPEILQKLEAAPESERGAILVAYIQTEVAAVLGLGVSQLPDQERGFFEIGMDSLTAVELKERLEGSLGSKLPATLVFESPNIKELAEYLGREVMGWSPVNDALLQGEDERTVAVSKIEQLSEDEVEASIADRLAKLESLMKEN
ncbi:MAG: SDR family NAD(P)-dependent oxidoreductase, partial [Chroococcidiopsidaceae cyanobacterium CP_BM_RX_35]|nr:SDR family NAD(P)-dependent oxidoreductase [Chroococcidiopsidaceae cyanobacterium CP_BM_RX_35]